MNPIFLLAALLFPRLTLLVCYLTDNIPPNQTDSSLDLILSILAPRLLVAEWCHEYNQPVWLVLFVLAFLFVVFGSGRSARNHNK